MSRCLSLITDHEVDHRSLEDERIPLPVHLPSPHVSPHTLPDVCVCRWICSDSRVVERRESVEEKGESN